MMTTRLRSQTFALLPNSRLNTPIVPGPQTSWVISTSAFTQTLSPAWTWDLPEARARIFSLKVIERIVYWRPTLGARHGSGSPGLDAPQNQRFRDYWKRFGAKS